LTRPPNRRGGRVSPRTVTLFLVCALAVGALVVGLPQIHERPAVAAVLPAAIDSGPSPWERSDTLQRGETLFEVLARGGISSALARGILGAADLNPRRLPIGLSLTMRGVEGDSVPDEILFHLDEDRLLTVRRAGDAWSSEETRVPWTTDTIALSGEIVSTLYDAMDAGAGDLLPARLRAELAWGLADIYEYRVDMSRDLQKGDAFRLLVERQTSPKGAMRLGDILAARFTLSGTEVQAVRFASDGARTEYFDQTGRSMRAAFLRAPLAFRRISSVFGMRKHPILGVWRKHTGTDYAANSGTPVRAIGDGTVIFAGRKGGYGNAIEIRHRNGFVSRYGHLRGFAKSVRSGRRVGIGETIGYVGMTGLATAPHLHFEVLVNGVQRDPRKSLDYRSGQPVAASKREAFDSTRLALIARLDADSETRRLAQAN
jgi:murein DD-endopeptidase MepM/ murein hydrolase activator NlpD